MSIPLPKDPEYTSSVGILELIRSLQNGYQQGTGIQRLVGVSRNLLGGVPEVVKDTAVSQLNSLFGNYPDQSDFAPSLVFTIIAFVLGVLHLMLFVVNLRRGHLFYISFLWCWISWLKGIGWAMRVSWSQDITKVNVGLASEVFLIVSGVFLVTVNLILAQRLFTWRHPVGGTRRLFTNFMYILYALLAAVIALTVVASAVPYLYYLSIKANLNYQICVMFSSILIILYSLTAISLLLLSYFFSPTTNDENLYTYQPWWIESFHPFYFVQPGAAQRAEETFMKRNHNHRHAVRVIAATDHHYRLVEGLTNQRGSLTHNKSIIIVTLTTLLGFVQAVLRSIAVFQNDPNYYNHPICKPIVAYISWGVLETLIHILYLVGRVDLRFYRPDILPAKVRAIITAEQSFYPSVQVSDIEDEDEDDEDDYDNVLEFDLSSDINSDSTPEKPVTYTQKPVTQRPDVKQPVPEKHPYSPRFVDKFESSSNDNESDFNF